MAQPLTRIFWGLWGGNGRKDDREASGGGNNTSSRSGGGGDANLSSSFDFGLGFREPEDTFRLSPRQARKAKRKWQSREERRRVHGKDDVVLVPSDGGCCLSGSESEDSDWSIGWLEPHAPDFLSDAQDVVDASFAVLVPCYGRARGAATADYGPGFKGSDNNNNRYFFPPIDLTNSSETRKYMEDLLSALQAGT